MKTRLTIVTLVCCQIISAQAPNWSWAKTGQGPFHDYGQSVSTDAYGNCYATGYFQHPTISFGSITLTGPTTHHDKFYLVKYDQAGNVIWAKSAPGSVNSAGTSVKTDPNGNSYVTGYFMQGDISFGNITLQPAHGSVPEAFIAKYDKDGNVLWAKSAGQAQISSLYYSVSGAIDNNGNMYVTANHQSLTPPTSGFIKKFDTDGNLVWSKHFTGNSRNVKISADANGNTYLTGTYFFTTLTFGTIVLPANSNGHVLFVAKYDLNGNVIWAKSEGVYASLYDPSIGVDGTGNCYVTGWFAGPFVQFGSTVLNNPGYSHEIFIAKFDANGNVMWAKQSIGGGHAYDIQTDINGNSYITGPHFGNIKFGDTTLLSTAHNDIFVAKYNSSGIVEWARSAGGDKNDIAMGITVSSKGNVFVTGNYTSSTSLFDNSAIINSDNIHYAHEVFIARLGDNPEDTIITDPPASCTMDMVKVYPNPARDILTIKKPATACKISMALYNNQGQLIFTGKTLNDGLNEIKLSPLSRGIYHYNFIAEGLVLLRGSFFKY